MEAIRNDGTLLEVAKKKAKEIAAAYPPSARFQLLTSDFDPVNQRLLSREEFLDMTDQVKISGHTRNLNDIVRRQHEALVRMQTGGGIHYIISDFQANMNNGTINKDSSEEMVLIPVQAARVNNIYIDSCWLGNPAVQLNQPSELFIRVVNDGDELAENISIKVMVDEQTRAVATLSAEAGKSAVTAVNFTMSQPGWHTGEVSVTDHPVTFDNTYNFSFEVIQSVAVMALNAQRTSPYLQALFGSNSFVNFSNALYTQVDYSTLNNSQLVIINELPQISSGLADELNKYLKSGGHVLVFPDSAGDISSYNNFFTQCGADAFSGINTNEDKVTKLDKNNELFADVFQQGIMQDGSTDYPVAKKHFDIVSTSKSNRQILMQLQGDAPFLSQYNVGKGSLYIFTVPLQPGFSNLARHAVFVPALYKMALLSLKGHDLAFTTGEDVALTLKGNADVSEGSLKITGSKNGDIIPQTRMTSSGLDVNLSEIKEAGHYKLVSNGKILSQLSFNYSRSESAMKMMTSEQLDLLMKDNNLENVSQVNASVPDLTKHLKQLTDGISLWKYCILIMLLFLLIETLLLRFWKT